MINKEELKKEIKDALSVVLFICEDRQKSLGLLKFKIIEKKILEAVNTLENF